jgi:hypothetical protein
LGNTVYPLSNTCDLASLCACFCANKTLIPIFAVMKEEEEEKEEEKISGR